MTLALVQTVYKAGESHSPHVGGVGHPAGRLAGRSQEVGVFGVGDEHEGPLAQGDIGEGEEVMVEGEETKPEGKKPRCNTT